MQQRARSLMIWVGASLLWALSPTLALAGAASLPAWVFIDEGEGPVQLASLSDGSVAGIGGTGFIPATNPASYGGLYNSTGSGVTTTPASSVTTSITNEAVGVLGAVDMHFQYTDRTPLAAGASQTVNFNFYDGNPSTTLVSDTLSLTFTGQAPAPGTGNNMLVDLHWRSDSADEIIAPPPLSNAHNLNEIPWATGNPAFELFSFIHADTGLSDAHFLVNSVPEPSSVVMMGLGALGVGGLVLRRRRKS